VTGLFLKFVISSSLTQQLEATPCNKKMLRDLKKNEKAWINFHDKKSKKKYKRSKVCLKTPVI